MSEATVSRVLNSKPGVASGTREAVLKVLEELGYDRSSRSATGRDGLIGLITPELDNPIFPAFAQVIATVLAQAGYTPVLCAQTPGGVTEDEYVELLLERGASGIVFVSGAHADTLESADRYRRLIERGLPIVLINGFVEGLAAPFVSADDTVAVDLAVKHLASLGHSRIGLAVGPARYTPVRRKVASFGASMARHVALGGIRSDDLIEWSLFSVEGGQTAADRLLDRDVTAIVCGSDLMALGAIRAARARGLHVPSDLSVVGFDDSPLIAFTDPPLTTLRQSVQPMGLAAVRALMDEMAGVAVTHAEYVFRPELVVRASTHAAPVMAELMGITTPPTLP